MLQYKNYIRRFVQSKGREDASLNLGQIEDIQKNFPELEKYYIQEIGYEGYINNRYYMPIEVKENFLNEYEQNHKNDSNLQDEVYGFLSDETSAGSFEGLDSMKEFRDYVKELLTINGFNVKDPKVRAGIKEFFNTDG
jgi:hypothetical protein